MCSLNDAEQGEDNLLMEQKLSTTSESNKVCRKCKINPSEIVLQISDVYCRNCFLNYEMKKFRSTLGKSKKMRPNDRVLVAYSGSQASLTLLHLLYEGRNDKNLSKRFVFEPVFVYIDEGAVLGLSKEQRNITKLSIANTMKTFSCEAYISSLDKALEASLDAEQALFMPMTLETHIIEDESDKKIQQIVNATSSLTSKEDLVAKLRSILLLEIAKQLKCCKIFLADVETDLAIKLLSNISLGRGAQLPLDVGFSDARDSDVEVLRPMRNFMKKEVVFYNNFNKLQETHVPSISTQKSVDSSIQKLTESFVMGLMNEFPQTVATIFRTGEKLIPTISADESCILCQGPLDTSYLESSALQATKFSSLISNLGPSSFDSRTIGNLGLEAVEKVAEAATATSSECCAKGVCGCLDKDSKQEMKVTWADAEDFTCYACRHITKEISKTVDQLPPRLSGIIRQRSILKGMRKEIEDFLI